MNTLDQMSEQERYERYLESMALLGKFTRVARNAPEAERLDRWVDVGYGQVIVNHSLRDWSPVGKRAF